MPITEGEPAPEFTLEAANGEQVSLKDFAGRHVIVYFYPRDDTPGCTKEACGFRDRWSEIQALGAVVIGVSPDGPTSHQKFAEKYELPFTLLCDPDKKMMGSYAAFGKKLVRGEKKLGVIRSTVWIGPDGTVRKHWNQVSKAEAHPEQVLAALKGG